jgi:hypothetical protein
MRAQAAVRPGDGRTSHLRLVTTADIGAAPAGRPPSSATRRELRESSRIARHLRRRARRLPADSPLREELLETAEYFATAS